MFVVDGATSVDEVVVEELEIVVDSRVLLSLLVSIDVDFDEQYFLLIEVVKFQDIELLMVVVVVAKPVVVEDTQALEELSHIRAGASLPDFQGPLSW